MLQGESIEGFVKHIEFLSEKAATGIYRADSIISYDSDLKAKAIDQGHHVFNEFSEVEVFRYLSFDGTIHSTRGVSHGQGQNKKGNCYCYDFNKEKGCHREFCKYRHICRVCLTGGHNALGCGTNKKSE